MPVKVQLLLKSGFRSPAGVAQAAEAAGAHGIRVTATGAASISGELPGDAAPNSSALSAGPLPIPPGLHEFVESMTVAPKHIQMRE
jgi:hypothetical protein